MATTEQLDEQVESENDDLAFAPKLDPRWALGLPHILIVAIFGLLFMLLNYIPIRGTDIWGHVGYGHWILEHRTLPQQDPWMPLAAGMRVIDSAWLAQVIFAAADRWIGPQAISHLFAIAGIGVFVIWARVFYLQSGRKSLLVLGVLLLLFLSWSRIATVRPETLASVCFALLFMILISAGLAGRDVGDSTTNSKTKKTVPWWIWIASPALFVVWANLHGSFVLGLAVLGCFALGHAIDVVLLNRGISALLDDRRLRTWILLCEASFAATLINPYGLDLLIYSATFSNNPILQSVLEWEPLVLLGPGGREFAFSVVLLLCCMRYSKRRIPAAHILLLALFAYATVKAVRMIGWYAPVYVFVVMPHLAGILGHYLPARPQPEAVRNDQGIVVALPPGRSFRFSLVCVLVVWIAFMLSPVSRTVLGRSPRPPEKLYTADTPLALTEYLREKRPTGQVFHPEPWGDWIMRDGPPDLQCFVMTNIHLIPRQVWRDYLRVIRISAGWERALERYDTEMVIVDIESQNSLLRAIRRNPDWVLDYEDDQAAVFVPARREPAPRVDEDQPSTDLAMGEAGK